MMHDLLCTRLVACVPCRLQHGVVKFSRSPGPSPAETSLVLQVLISSTRPGSTPHHRCLVRLQVHRHAVSDRRLSIARLTDTARVVALGSWPAGSRCPFRTFLIIPLGVNVYLLVGSFKHATSNGCITSCINSCSQDTPHYPPRRRCGMHPRGRRLTILKRAFASSHYGVTSHATGPSSNIHQALQRTTTPREGSAQHAGPCRTFKSCHTLLMRDGSLSCCMTRSLTGFGDFASQFGLICSCNAWLRLSARSTRVLGARRPIPTAKRPQK